MTQRSSRERKWIGIIAFAVGIAALLIIVIPTEKSLAQRNNSHAEIRRRNLDLLRQFDKAAQFYNNLSSQEPDWNLVKTTPPHPIDKDFKVIRLDLRRNAKTVRISIYEYPTVEKAVAMSFLNNPLNARVESFTKYGEGGRKVFGYDGFANLGFRVQNFIVSVLCEDEEVAERFAGYAFNAVIQ